jgi:glycolate oxidase
MKQIEKMFKKITQKILAELEEIAGKDNVIRDEEKMLDYWHDEFSLTDIAHAPDVVVKPGNTQEVSEILKLATREMIPVTPRGGATGLCGGCVPQYGGIVLSLERMNNLLKIDNVNQMAEVEAGVTLSEFYSRIEDSGLFFPPHPGEESAMLGGIISTNAGGARAVKYGVIRNYVRGLEVVLPSGDIIHLGGKLMKSSTGYNLLNLLIGSEGTLGVITKAVIQLLTPPEVIRSLIIPYDMLEKAIDSVPYLIERKIMPLAVEFVPIEVIQITKEFLKKRWPSSLGSTHLMIILDASSEEEMDRLSEVVAAACLEKGALDVFVADSPKKQQQVLEIRSKIYEAIKKHTLEILDIVVPRAEIAGHVRKVQEVSHKYGIWLPTFGHAADGNVHTHIMGARYEDRKIIPLPEKIWKPQLENVRKALYKDCKDRGGMISGEHGIGIVKKPYLSYVLGEKEISLMRGIKNWFDPHGILNPGKIFD